MVHNALSIVFPENSAYSTADLGHSIFDDNHKFLTFLLCDAYLAINPLGVIDLLIYIIRKIKEREKNEKKD